MSDIVRRGPGRPSNAEKLKQMTLESTNVGTDKIPKQYRTDAIRVDSWNNMLAGLGSRQDKRRRTYQTNDGFVSDQELEAVYFNDGIATRIIDVVADDMTREWVDLGEDDDTGENETVDKNESLMREILEDMGAQNIYNEALKWSRLYGGALVYMAPLDGNPLDTPLMPQRIKEFGTMKVIDRSDVDIFLSNFELDPTKPNFGEPVDFWVWIQTGVIRVPYRIHASRCIVFKGKLVPRGASSSLSLQQRFWGLSELQCLYEILKDFGGAHSSVANLLYELVIGKWKLKDLAGLLANGQEALVQKRMDIMDASKSMLRSVMIDSEEDFVRDSASLAGLGDVFDRFMMRLAGAAAIPMTRLFGMSPGGMNATGESDLDNYYDMVRSKQRTYLKPKIKQLYDVIAAWKKIDPMPVKLKPLTQLNQKEQAEVQKLEADAFKTRADGWGVYIDKGVVDGMEARKAALHEVLEDADIDPEEEPDTMDLETAPGAETSTTTLNNKTKEQFANAGQTTEEIAMKNRKTPTNTLGNQVNAPASTQSSMPAKKSGSK